MNVLPALLQSIRSINQIGGEDVTLFYKSQLLKSKSNIVNQLGIKAGVLHLDERKMVYKAVGTRGIRVFCRDRYNPCGTSYHPRSLSANGDRLELPIKCVHLDPAGFACFPIVHQTLGHPPEEFLINRFAINPVTDLQKRNSSVDQRFTEGYSRRRSVDILDHAKKQDIALIQDLVYELLKSTAVLGRNPTTLG